MSIIELLLIGIGLSMDAFAVSVCKGLGMTKLNKKNAFLIALFFGGFQALMPYTSYAKNLLISLHKVRKTGTIPYLFSKNPAQKNTVHESCYLRLSQTFRTSLLT